MLDQTQMTKKNNLVIIWGALLFSNFIYGFVIYTRINKMKASGDPFEPNDMLLPVMGSLGALAYVAAFFLYKFFLKDAKKKLNNPTKDEMVEAYTVPFIVKLALYEGAVIIFMVLGMLNQDIKYFLPAFVLNIGLFIKNFPSDQNVREAFKA